MINVTFKDRPEEALCWRMPKIDLQRNSIFQRKKQLIIERGLAVLVKYNDGISDHYRYGSHELILSRAQSSIEIFVFVVSETQCFFGGRSNDHKICANGSYYVSVKEGAYNLLQAKLGTVPKALVVDDITAIANQNISKVITDSTTQNEFNEKLTNHLSSELGKYGLEVSNVTTDYFGE